MSSRKAHIDLNKKLKMERSLYRDVRSMFREMANDSPGPIFNVNVYVSPLTDALRNHYISVMNLFSDDYRETNNKSMLSNTEDIMLAKLNDVAYNRSFTQASFILKTSDKQLVKAKEKVSEEMMRSDTRDQDPDIMLTNIFYRMLLGRVDSIACYETQWASEIAKFTEFTYFAGLTNVEIKAPNIEGWKRWDAVGDDKMRDWHAAADSQVVLSHRVFTVMGEALMYPGDTSLGASAANIINCRCSAFYDPDVVSLTSATSGPSTAVVNITSPGDIFAAPKKLVNPKDIELMEKRIEDTIANASGKSSGELKEIQAELTAMKKRIKDGLPTYNADFLRLNKRLREVRRDLGLITKPKPRKRHTLRDRKPKKAKRRKVTNKEYDDAISLAKSEIDELFKGGIYGDFEHTNFTRAGRVREKSIKRIKELNKLDDLNSDVSFDVAKDILKTIDEGWVGKRVYGSVESVISDVVDKGLANARLIDRQIQQLKIDVRLKVRAFASKWQNLIALESTAGKRIVAHELGHHLEFRNPGVQKAASTFLSDRINIAESKGEEMMRRRYSSGVERMWKDGFYDPYVGKIYSDGATEVVSMGLQSFYDDSSMRKMLKSDPEHFQLTWAILRGFF